MQDNQKDKVESTVDKGGAPEGNNNAAKGRQVTAMLEAALNSNNKSRMRDGVEMIAEAFANGEIWAVNTVFDRLEGKPAQAVTLSGDNQNPLAISLIERVIVKPTDSNA